MIRRPPIPTRTDTLSPYTTLFRSAYGASTLTAFTAGTVGKALDMLPVRPDRLIVCGGGRKNPTLMAELARRADVQALAAEAVGLRGDAIEAECFAFLAMRKIHDLPKIGRAHV